MIRILFALLLSSPFFAFAQVASADQKPRNVILMLGDGMGLSQVSAGLYYQDSPSNFERFPVIGLIKTSSASQLVTDSAAGATAFASGVKSYNGAIGVSTDTLSVPNIPELLEPRGYSSGIIATSSIVHASIATFYAHVPYRFEYEAIAEDLVESKLDFIVGGGLKFFNNRKDQKDLIPLFLEKGFTVHTQSLPTELTADRNLILLADDALPEMTEGRGDLLPRATQLALNTLSKNKEGFFLLVEGSQIDWGGHDNDANYLIAEQLDFDRTIGRVLDFAQQRDDTLVIVLADHETGGFTLSADGDDYNKIKPTFSTGGHSATMIPVFAYGPGASSFSGIYENTAIFHKIMALLDDAPVNPRR
jgi:alkaline phosphatase